ARGDPTAHKIAHVASQFGVAVRYRLTLADETAQLRHQGLRLSFLFRVGQLAVGPISGRQVAVGEGRSGQNQSKSYQNRSYRAERSAVEIRPSTSLGANGDW